MPLVGAEYDKATQYRLERLIDAGYAPKCAQVIAHRHDIDLHQAVELAQNPKCGWELAALILL